MTDGERRRRTQRHVDGAPDETWSFQCAPRVLAGNEVFVLDDPHREYGGVADRDIAKRDLLDLEIDIRRRRADGAVLSYEVARDGLDDAAVRLAGEGLDDLEGLLPCMPNWLWAAPRTALSTSGVFSTWIVSVTVRSGAMRMSVVETRRKFCAWAAPVWLKLPAKTPMAMENAKAALRTRPTSRVLPMVDCWVTLLDWEFGLSARGNRMWGYLER